MHQLESGQHLEAKAAGWKKKTIAIAAHIVGFSDTIYILMLVKVQSSTVFTTVEHNPETSYSCPAAEKWTPVLSCIAEQEFLHRADQFFVSKSIFHLFVTVGAQPRLPELLPEYKSYCF